MFAESVERCCVLSFACRFLCMIPKKKVSKYIELNVVVIYLPSILDQAAIRVTSNLKIVTTFEPIPYRQLS